MPEPGHTLDDLLSIVRPFVAGGFTATEFAELYMRTFKDTRVGNQQVFNILDQLFVDADDYYDDPNTTAEQRSADAEQLSDRAREALATIERIMAT